MLRKIIASVGLGFAGYVVWDYFKAQSESYYSDNSGAVDGLVNVALSTPNDLEGLFLGDVMGFSISLDGLAYLKNLEGTKIVNGRYVIHDDGAGYPTIGWGHKILPNEDFSKGLTESEAVALLAKDLAIHEQAVNDYVKVPIHQFMFDALVIFSYNVGRGALKTSTLLRKLNQKDYQGASEQFGAWVYGGKPKKIMPSLVRRRNREMLLFNEGLARL